MKTAHLERKPRCPVAVGEAGVPKPAKVVVANHHPVVLSALCRVLRGVACAEVVGEAGSQEEILEVLRRTSVDLLITDFSMPVGGTPERVGMIDRVRARYPNLAVVVLTMADDSLVHQAILACGVQGLVDKASSLGELNEAVQSVHCGCQFVSASFGGAASEP